MEGQWCYFSFQFDNVRGLGSLVDQCSFKNVQTEGCVPLVLCRSLSFSLFHIVFH